MNMDFGSLFSSLMIGLVGMGVFMYAKKAGAPLAFGVSVGLMVFPYFVSNLIAMWAIAVGLLAILFLPHFLNNRGI